MSLLEDDIALAEEKKRKRKVGRIAVFGLLGLLLLIAIVRAAIVIFFPSLF